MLKKIIYAALALPFVILYSCKQELSDADIIAVKNSRPTAEALASNYSYATVAVPQGFEEMAQLLLFEDPSNTSNGLFGPPLFASGPLTAGKEIQIASVSDAKAKLGRVLFYDKKLSINSTISCGSCHHQDKGFADGKVVSTGFEGRLTSRNSMSIINPAMMHSGMFWDRRESSARGLSLRPVVNHIEMGMEDLKLLEIKLAGTDYYPQLFANAYPEAPFITKDNISDALTAFLRSMVTWNSKFDQGMRSNFSNFTAEELRGKELFMGNHNGNFVNIDPFGNVISTGACGGCHSAPMFNDGGFSSGISAYSDNDTGNGKGVNIGLDRVSKDKGTGDGSFKIPSLRNIELTAPYMHDGRFNTLEQVVDHYNEKIQPAANLHHRLKDENGRPKRFNFSEADKKALVAFMKTLTDKQFVNDPRFSNPFEN